MGEYEEHQSAHFDELAKDLDRVCEHRLKNIHQLLSNERPPYPPPHTVTLARAVHVLAMRALADSHPAKHPRSKSYASKGRHGLHLYWMTVFRLNEGISGAAQAGALSLRDRLTGFPNANFRQPSKERAIEWEQAAITRRASNQTEKLTFDRRAVEIMCSFSWALLDGHFDESVVVSLSELDDWAVGAGITDRAGVSSLLNNAEAESAERARITSKAIAAEERGETYDAATSGTSEEAAPPAPQVTVTVATPVQRQRSQEDGILTAIAALNLSAVALPKPKPGKSGVKAQVRAKLNMTGVIFDKAWERLRARGEIKDAS